MHAWDFIKSGSTVLSLDCPRLFLSCGGAFVCFCRSTKVMLDRTHSSTCELLMFDRLLRSSVSKCSNYRGEPTRSNCEILTEIGSALEPRRPDAANSRLRHL